MNAKRNTPVITDSELSLLDNITHNRRVQTWATMPTGSIPKPTKRKSRPNSASANLQTHHVHSSGLYEPLRPSTAALAKPSAKHPVEPRPKTRAGELRGKWQSADTLTTPGNQERRSTIGPASVSVSEAEDLATSRINASGLGTLLRSKVSVIF